MHMYVAICFLGILFIIPFYEINLLAMCCKCIQIYINHYDTYRIYQVYNNELNLQDRTVCMIWCFRVIFLRANKSKLT